MRRVHDWNAIQRYYDEGHGFVECRNRFRLSHTAWVKAIRRGELVVEVRPFTDRRRRYDWTSVQVYYDEGHSVRACMRRFGFCLAAWTRAVARGEVTARPATKALGVVLVSRSSRWFKKAKLLKEGRFENRCCCCGLDSWLGKPLSIQIDHINGKNDDWRIENLRMLCPNCHSQTPTFAGRNQKRATQLPEQPKVM